MSFDSKFVPDTSTYVDPFLLTFCNRGNIPYYFMIKYVLVAFWSSSLVARTHTIKCGEVECLRFEPQTLHKLFNVPTN